MMAGCVIAIELDESIKQCMWATLIFSANPSECLPPEGLKNNNLTGLLRKRSQNNNDVA